MKVALCEKGVDLMACKQSIYVRTNLLGEEGNWPTSIRSCRGEQVERESNGMSLRVCGQGNGEGMFERVKLEESGGSAYQVLTKSSGVLV